MERLDDPPYIKNMIMYGYEKPEREKEMAKCCICGTSVDPVDDFTIIDDRIYCWGCVPEFIDNLKNAVIFDYVAEHLLDFKSFSDCENKASYDVLFDIACLDKAHLRARNYALADTHAFVGWYKSYQNRRK